MDYMHTFEQCRPPLSTSRFYLLASALVELWIESLGPSVERAIANAIGHLYSGKSLSW